MKFAVDTGALLSLSCSTYFKDIRKKHVLLTTPEVMRELENIAAYGDFLGSKAKDVLKANIKTVRVPQSEKFVAAEESVFALARKQKCIAITDDIRAARKAHYTEITTRPSLYLIGLLYKKKIIDKHQLIQDISNIAMQRNWLGGALWQYAVKLIEQLDSKDIVKKTTKLK